MSARLGTKTEHSREFYGAQLKIPEVIIHKCFDLQQMAARLPQ
jgi:hypothetical protein